MSEQEQDIIRQSELLTYLFRTHRTGHPIPEVKGDDWPAIMGFAEAVLKVKEKTLAERLRTQREFKCETPIGILTYDHILKKASYPQIKPPNENPVKVTPSEGLILVDLIQHQGFVRNSLDLLATVRIGQGDPKLDIPADGAAEIIKVHMRRLRSKLGDVDHLLIRVSRGSGYYIPLPDDQLPKLENGQ